MAGRSRVVSPALRLDTLRLTPTERQLLKLIAHGLKPPQIAQRRVVAQATVRKQIELLIEKLGLANREELIAWSVRNGYAEISIDDL
jgi:DNA-binding NarL/FixJ family response regulator